MPDGTWQSAKISDEAHAALRLAAALTNSDMRELASEAILHHCQEIFKRHGLKFPRAIK